MVNEGFFANGGMVRAVPVAIGGSKYAPPLPIELEVKEKIDSIIKSQQEPIDIAIELALYCMKTQVFIDGNKRAAIIFANHYLIQHGAGLLVVPEKQVDTFKKTLVNYYEGSETNAINLFLKELCWRKF